MIKNAVRAARQNSLQFLIHLCFRFRVTRNVQRKKTLRRQFKCLIKLAYRHFKARGEPVMRSLSRSGIFQTHVHRHVTHATIQWSKKNHASRKSYFLISSDVALSYIFAVPKSLTSNCRMSRDKTKTRHCLCYRHRFLSIPANPALKICVFFPS